MSEGSSYRQILRSSSIIGGASVLNIVISLLRTKVAAVLLGPAGIGLIGLLQNLIATASAVAAMGFGTVGTRQIAEAAGRDDSDGIAAARRALFWGTLFLSSMGVFSVWLLRKQLAVLLLGNVELTGDVGWLALGVGLTVAAGAQGALLNGLRRIGDIARVSVWSSLLSTLVGIGVLLVWGRQALLVFILVGPFATFVVGHMYVSRLPKIRAPSTSLPQLMAQWRILFRLGAAFMVTGVVVTLGQLAVRSMTQHELGAEALGQFQAAWAISMTYISFVLGAMGTDYYPRLTALIDDPAAVNRIVNEQTEVALLLAGPLFLGMLALAPWVIELLYSSNFDAAASILRWQILGDVLKVASWPLGFILLAAGDGRAFMLTESLAISVFVGLVWFGLPLVGIQATGIAFLGIYIVYLPLIYWLAWRRTGFSWDKSVSRLLLLLISLSLVITAAAYSSKWLGAGVGVMISFLVALASLARIGHMANLSGPLKRLADLIRLVMKRGRIWSD